MMLKDILLIAFVILVLAIVIGSIRRYIQGELDYKEWERKQ